MNSTSYLLAIDGSQEACSAAHFAWDLANQTDSSVVAQHVVDTKAIWRFLSYDLAGFIGSGPYMDAKERITETLHSIAEALMLSYGSQAGGHCPEFETYIDDGEPADEIARRALDHDLVIIGYHGRHVARRPRLFEKLAETCPCPVLIVRDVSERWSKMQVLITNDIADPKTIHRIYQLGTVLGLPGEVYLDRSVAELDAEHVTLKGWSSALGVRAIKHGNLKEVITSAPDDSLLVVPAEMATYRYDSRCRSRIRAFLEDSDRRALLLWRDRDS